jgi:hypothetical protein
MGRRTVCGGVRKEEMRSRRVLYSDWSERLLARLGVAPNTKLNRRQCEELRLTL